MSTVFDLETFANITQTLSAQAPDRPRAMMVDNNAYYMLVNMHIFLCNMVEFAGSTESELEPLINQLAREVERLQDIKGRQWYEDFATGFKPER
jgi:hypothetical protein